MPGLFLFTLYAAFVWASKVAITFLLLLVGFCFLPAGSVRSSLQRAGAFVYAVQGLYLNMTSIGTDVASLPAFRALVGLEAVFWLSPGECLLLHLPGLPWSPVAVRDWPGKVYL